MNKVNNLKHIVRGCALALILAMFIDVPVHADTTGSINISLKELSASSNIEGVKFQLYRVGTVSEFDEPSLDTVYNISSYPQTASELDATAKTIAENNQGILIQESSTNSRGQLSFTGLEKAVYLVVASQANNYGEVSPFLVNLPYYEELEEIMMGPIYTADVEPKASGPSGGSTEGTPLPTGTISPTVTETPSITTNPGTTPTKTTTTGSSSTSSKTGTAKTGDTTSITGWAFLGLMGLLVAMSVVFSRRGHKRQDS